jgi:glyoxylase-like metal-dependent hydrolase (beta-lactamase superfamily II)
MDIKEVADGVFTFRSPVKNINRVLTSYVIRNTPAVLIDPGPATAIPYIREALKQLGITELSYVIPTHIHLDHAGAIGELSALYPAAKMVLHPSSVRHMADPARLIESTRMAFGEYFEDTWGTIMPVPESHMKIVEDGETIDAGGRKLRIIYSPGHAPHHISIYDEKTGGIFSGEALGVPRPGAEEFPLPAVVPPSFDPDTYLNTILKLQALKPRLIFYGHDGVSTEPEKMIEIVYNNTLAIGDIVLKALKAGDTPQKAGEKIQQFVEEHTGVHSEFSDRSMTVVAYLQYYKKKGLI